ncbi:MAG: phosphate ABC transporter substrate-binding protein PstS [Actinomyces sp.]|uniref:phosphate ABC transporter substrate-binding protein PstS n=1 Tax=Actinomyces sp. TaxID=29317 RepID=UPI0026DBEBB6|nr:phosphate ABC transporter substrate-binding protein PstS [Actinomyces sp.]MDO4244337.1 phosphate ABC transporter substrate-binding protein PstS [Actinomyces sp.]
MVLVTRRVAIGTLSVGALTTLAACGSDAGGTAHADPNSTLSGEVKGAGATSQADAQEAWLNAFMDVHAGVTVEYAGGGSGAGRTKLIEGAVDFAGSDSAMKEDEVASMGEWGVVEVPLYISPIAVAYNLPDLDTSTHVNMTGEVVAQVFAGQITTWNDPRLTALNPGVALPDTAIIPVHRSDDSGTTKSFTSYLSAVAPEVWTHEADDAWPLSGGQSGDGTSGVVSTLRSAEGTIGYADASKVDQTLGTVAVGTADSFVSLSAEAAAATLEASQPAEDATDTRVTYTIDYTAEGGYPIILVSYLVARQRYDDPDITSGVKAYFEYMASAEGQTVAAEASGCAPLSEQLRAKVLAAISTIGS